MDKKLTSENVEAMAAEAAKRLKHFDPETDCVMLHRKGSDEPLHCFYLPTSGPTMKCFTSKNFGGGEYELHLMGDLFGGLDKRIRDLIIEEDDRQCPFMNHCSP